MISRADQGRGTRDAMARWERDDGSVRYVPDRTMCWRPRYPQILRIVRDGWSSVIRCGDCPGCREFEALHLARRLVRTYRAIAAAEASSPPGLCLLRISNKVSPSTRWFAVRVYCPKEKQSSTLLGIRRAVGVDVSFGFARAGLESFIVVTSTLDALGTWLGRRKLRFEFRPMSRLDRRRAWRWFTRGLIVPRSSYGENINRWYCRGLARLDKLKWEVERDGGYRSFDVATSPRVVAESFGRLVPPAMRQLLGNLRVRVRNLFDRASNPEQVVALMSDVHGLVARIGNYHSGRPFTETPESRADAEAYLAALRARKSTHLVNAKPSEFSSPPLVGGVTELLDNSCSSIGRPMSSIHSSGAPPPSTREQIRAEAAAVEASEKHRSDFLAQRAKKKTADAIERLRALVERVKPKED